MAKDPAEHVPNRLNQELEDALKDFENQDTPPATPTDDTPPDTGSAPPPETPPAAAPSADPPAAPPAAVPDGEQPGSAPGGVNTEGAPPPPAKPAPAEDDGTWEQRYRVLDGKFRAEVPRLHHRLQVALDENAQLRRRIEGIAPPATTPKGEADRLNKAETIAKNEGGDPRLLYDLTENELEYGSEMISLAEKIAGKIVEKRIGAVESKAQAKEFYAELEQRVPDWREINNDPAFKDFCDQAEPNSGLLWQQIIDGAQASLDPVRIEHVFTTFRTQQHTTRKPPASPAATTPLDAQVSPTPAPAPPSPQGKKVYSVKEWGQLMDNITLGRYTAKQAEKIKAELDAAFSEGRIKE